MSFAELLADEPVASADLTHHVTFMAATPVSVALRLMNDQRAFCALVTEDAALAGVFTDRDVLTRCVGKPGVFDRPVREVMTPRPRTVEAKQPLIDALRLMNRHRIRNVPVRGGAGEIAGNLTHFALMDLIDRLLMDSIPDHDDDLDTRHSLAYVDFRGVAVARPVSVISGTTLGHAIRQMQTRGIGSVLVVDRRGSLAGMFTESDVQRKVAGKVADLNEGVVDDFMTTDPFRLTPRDPIAAAFRLMAEHRFSHVPLVGATRKPVGIVSFRDLADYLETALTAAA